MSPRLAVALLAITEQCSWGCTPPAPAPVVPDAQADGGCATLDAITAQRLIRGPDGMPLVIHCDGGAP